MTPIVSGALVSRYFILSDSQILRRSLVRATIPLDSLVSGGMRAKTNPRRVENREKRREIENSNGYPSNRRDQSPTHMLFNECTGIRHYIPQLFMLPKLLTNLAVACIIGASGVVSVLL